MFQIIEQDGKWRVKHKDAMNSDFISEHDTADQAVANAKAILKAANRELRGVTMSVDSYDGETAYTRLEARGSSDEKGILAQFLAIANRLIGNDGTKEKPKGNPLGRQIGFKVLDDDQHWVAYYSNAAEDQSGEIFPMAETDNFIARANKGIVPMPELWRWHTPGTKHGQAEWLDRVGLVTMAVGSFDKTPIADKFKAYYKQTQQHNSHGFFYDPAQVKGGVYGYYDTFEISTLPIGKADNPYTVFDVIGAKSMNEEKIKDLLGIVTEAEAETMVKNAAQHSKALLEAGVKFKAAETPAAPTTVTVESAKSADTVSATPIEAKIDALTANVKALVDVLSGNAPKAPPAPDPQLVAMAEKAGFKLVAAEAPQAPTQSADPTVAALQTQVKDLTTQLKQFMGDTPRPTQGNQVASDSDLVNFYKSMNANPQAAQPTQSANFFDPIIAAMTGQTVPTQ